MSSLSPYPIKETETGYEFTTDAEASYELAFRDDADYFPGENFLGPVLSFAIALVDGEVGLKDPRVEITVSEVLQLTFQANPHTIITYTCSAAEGQARTRNTLFRLWFRRSGAGFARVEYSNPDSGSFAVAFYKKSHPFSDTIKRVFTETFNQK